MDTPRNVIMFSGGLGSWAAAKRVAETEGTDGLVLLFADVLTERPGLYTFLEAAAKNIGGQFIRICEGRTPQQVMEDVAFIGNSQYDPCSKILKRDFMDKWRDEHCDPELTTIHVGIDWSESHRLDGIRKRVAPWRYEAPLCEAPFITKKDMIVWAMSEGLPVSESYIEDWPHDNCSGACVKAGQAQWARLYFSNKSLYLDWEDWERRMRAKVGDHSILKDRRGMKPGDKPKVLTLHQFREEIERGERNYDRFEWGGCGCAL